jgi:hypothetical protein
VNLASRIDRATNDPAWRLLPGHSKGWLKSLLQPLSLAWLVMLLPSILWLVVGGWPQTAAIQKTMAASPAWELILAVSVAGQV